MAETISGAGIVIDGDTLTIGGRTVRLHGIDAPEHDQFCRDAARNTYPCGLEAARALRALAQGPLSCTGESRDRYGRMIAVCRTSEIELNREMVAAGWALAFRRYSSAYIVDEDVARTARRGLWAGGFAKPWDWRAGKTEVSAGGRPFAPAAERPNCRIKGNISGNGRIYHVPGSDSYARTRISTAKGERWFCSEAEARAAGWRAPAN